jgi:hypothetical protein
VGESGSGAAWLLLEELTARAERLLGTDHDLTVGMRFGVAERTGVGGEPAAAAAR